MRHFYILDDVCKSLANVKEGKEQESAGFHYTQKFEELYKLLENRVGKKISLPENNKVD